MSDNSNTDHAAALIALFTAITGVGFDELLKCDSHDEMDALAMSRRIESETQRRNQLEAEMQELDELLRSAA